MLSKKLKTYLTLLMEKHRVSVVGYVIVNNYKITAADIVSIDPAIKTSINSLFQACSLSKCLTAYAILKLIAENKLNLDQAINQQLISWEIPRSPYSEDITLRQCLNMTSGLCYGELDATFPDYTQHQTLPSLNNILNGILPANNLPIKSIYPPGSCYAYSGAGYMVLQQLIEDITHESFINYMDNEILKNLNMTHSRFEYPKITTSIIPGFNKDNHINPDGWHPIPTTASGGLWSTPLDIAKFILEISRSPLANEIFAPQKNSRFKFNLGFVIDNQNKNLNFRKNGHNSDYHHELLMFPHTGQGIVVMTNAASGIVLINHFIAEIAKQFQWPDYALDFNEL